MTQHWRNLETEAELSESWHVTTFAVDCSEALSCCMLLLVGFSAIFPLCILLVDKDNFIHWQTISVLSFPSSIVFKSSNFFSELNESRFVHTEQKEPLCRISDSTQNFPEMAVRLVISLQFAFFVLISLFT